MHATWILRSFRILPLAVMPKNCSFNTRGLFNAKYKRVRQINGDLRRVFCVVCDKTINLTRMGESALCGNQTSGKGSVKSFFKRKGSEDCAYNTVATRSGANVDTGSRVDTVMSIPPPPAVNPSDVTSSGKMVSQFYSKSDVLKSEVLWTSSKYRGRCSYNSNENIDKINRAVSDQPSSCKVYPRFKEDIFSCVLGTAEQLKEMLTKFLNGYFTILFL